MPDTTLTIISGGTEYDFSAGALDMEGGLGFWRMEEDGLGMVPVRRINEQGPLQHGVTDLGFRLQPRTIILVFGLYGGQGTGESEFYDLRATLMRVFRPADNALSLRYDLANGDSRQVDCHYSGALSLPSKDRKGFYQKVGVELYAPDPTFYDPSLFSETFGIGGGAAGFTVPWPIPFSVGASSINQTRTISYGGTWRSFPFVRLKGPLTDPVITNQTTGDTLDFSGTTIASGDYYDIDCRYGYKTVVDSSGTNRISRLTSDSDLATFSLEADPEAPGGQNGILVNGTGITNVSEVYIQYYERFVGI